MNREVRKFIIENNLQPADAIIAKKIGYRVFDHYIIYVGYDYSHHWFMANSKSEGVRYYNENEVVELVKKFEPVRIEKFEGNDFQRQEAAERAASLQGKPYSLFGSNCEHFANYVQYGVKESRQLTNWVGVGLLALVIGTLAFGK